MILGVSGEGAFPSILAELDSEGNILSQKGYPNFTPKVESLSDGSILLGSFRTFDSTGQIYNRTVIAKTDSTGNVNGCQNYPSCLKSENIMLETDNIEFTEMAAPDLIDLDVDIKPASMYFEEYCGFPTPPSPEFEFPDTICVTDSAFTTNTNNRWANEREWHLSGPDSDTILKGAFNFGFRFLLSGNYVLRQSIWMLGCEFEYEHKIFVLPVLETEMTPLKICPYESHELKTISNRPVIEHLWDNGSTEPTLPIQESGTYTVETSDGICKSYDTSFVEVIVDIIGNEEIIFLPPDTTICMRHLPIQLIPECMFTDSFFIDGHNVRSDTLILEKEGDYLIGTEIYGCLFYEKYNIKLMEDCSAKIYFPNIFSPNNDGINDAFYPTGKYFEILELNVFDRWGGLRYAGRDRNAKWTPDSRTAQGTYLYMLKYKNTLLDKEEIKSGSFVLIR